MAEENDVTKHLEHVSWMSCIVDGERFLIKYQFLSSSYCVMLSDFIGVYVEVCSSEQIKDRSAELNPNIEISIERLLMQLTCSIEECIAGSNNLTLLEKGSGHLKLKCESVLAEVPFIWHYHLISSDPSYNYVHITLPLIKMISELNRRSKELIAIIKKKDNEIEDHRASGSKSSHKSLETRPFSETQFVEDMNKSDEMLECLKNSTCIVFENDLYSTLLPFLHIAPVKDKSEKKLELKGEVDRKKAKISSPELVADSTSKDHGYSEKEEEIKRRLQLQQQTNVKVKKKTKKSIKF